MKRMVITLVSGILMAIGVFLPWASIAAWWGGGISVSAWDGYKLAGLAEAWDVLVYLIAAIVVAACASIVLIIYLIGGKRKTVRNLSILASVGALVAVGTFVWGAVDGLPEVMDELELTLAELFGDFLDFGFYIYGVAAIVGLFAALAMLSDSGREPKALLRGIVAPSLSVEERIEKLAKLKEDGMITEQEFQDRKSKLLDQLVQEETTVASSNTPADFTPEDIRCPICGSETVIRTAKRGSNAGRQFYVCARYPECKGRIAIE